MTRQELIDIGFREIGHFTIMNCLVYDLGRRRSLSIGNIGDPNECLFICEHSVLDYKVITDTICLRNWDYDGYMTIEDVKNIINSITVTQHNRTGV